MLTTKEAAEELGVSTRTLERWRRAGTFVPKGQTIGGHSRYTPEQVIDAKRGKYSKDDIEEMLE